MQCSALSVWKWDWHVLMMDLVDNRQLLRSAIRSYVLVARFFGLDFLSRDKARYVEIALEK